LTTAFYGAAAFNADISKWSTAKVTNMDASTFNISTFLSSVHCSVDGVGLLTHLNLFVFSFVCSVFRDSGFKRTLCGGEWQSLSPGSYLTVTGRLGCCPIGSFMSDPMLNPFSEEKSCQQCSTGTEAVSSNDDTQCTTIASSPAAETEANASNSNSMHTAMIGTVMMAFVVVVFFNAW
tara:strand:- start:55 stop:588 length:534 start_codon:yes stop_codon:yes gene_type:complete